MPRPLVVVAGLVSGVGGVIAKVVGIERQAAKRAVRLRVVLS